MDRGRP